MNLNKAQITALSSQITNETNKEIREYNAEMEQKQSILTDIKLKKFPILEEMISAKIINKYTATAIFKQKFATQFNAIKIKNILQFDTVYNKIVLATIDSTDLEELIAKVKQDLIKN